MDSKYNIHSMNGSDDEDQPLLHNRSPEQQQARVILSTHEDPILGINTIDNEERETQPLLDKCNVESSRSSFLLCTNMPARYTIAIWVFIGFFCSYAARVNLSVAIVAMVSKSNI